MSYRDRLEAAIAARGRLCVGIDPSASLLEAWGLNDDVDGLRSFSRRVVDELGGEAAVFKPQVSFFERFGSAGFAVLEETIAALRSAGALVLADAKRGDIGSTMAGYAEAWFGEGSPLEVDALTVSPYLGFESLRPALDMARERGKGLYVLGLTSNPEGASVQHVGGDASVAKSIIDAAAAESLTGGHVGLVIGATTAAAAAELGIDLSAVKGSFLTPGLGAQGATVADIKRSFGQDYSKVLAPSSRDILKHGDRPGGMLERYKEVSAELAE
ncbi:orotidine-5'-phosphate decarboxylase [Falsarthrobacter nasiphocae]|uniref:Orotidine-5'-phosphate decarboxylase n=1 Tax=Falsarthrobacter nasiphocae TaxID=189863 RepID=A0AAE4C7Y0_9MICC|nr:orotidine-5'-phosphate decarboxylase [Falsarthrobacter nasiphocae]MDR6892989.1 orotidine-5'-phosphate decarboxylase [Falsarthrobacter nasiphocae]